jgi:hypothetical protein
MNLSPDQVSSIAATFTSTRPVGRKMSRSTSSVMSVFTFEAFLGQENQTMPSGLSDARIPDSIA